MLAFFLKQNNFFASFLVKTKLIITYLFAKHQQELEM